MQTEVGIREVVEALGLPPQEHLSQIWFSDVLDKGLPVASLERVAVLIGPAAPGGKTVTRLIIPAGTLKRRRQRGQPLSPQESQRLERAARLWTMALDVFGGPDNARRFLGQPHPLLRGQSPIEVAVTNDVGCKAVEHILGRLKYGSAA